MTINRAAALGWRLERAPARDEEGFDPWGGQEPPWLWISKGVGLPIPGGRTVEEALAVLDAIMRRRREGGEGGG